MIHTQIIFTQKEYQEYYELLEDYQKEINDFVFGKDGRTRIVDSPYNRAMLFAINDKYQHLQKMLFPHEKGEEFDSLWVGTAQSLQDKINNFIYVSEQHKIYEQELQKLRNQNLTQLEFDKKVCELMERLS